MAATDAPDAAASADDRSILFHTADEIVATRRLEAALSTKNGTQKNLVQPHEANQHIRGDVPDPMTQSRSQRALR